MEEKELELHVEKLLKELKRPLSLEEILKLRIESHLRRLREIEERRYATEFGVYKDLYKYNVTLAPRERKLLVEAYGPGALLDHLASITMPDDTPPEVEFEIKFDETLVLDWTCHEYYALLGLYPPAPGYGGCSIYDTVRRRYAWWTTYVPELGDFTEVLQVWLANLTDVTVTVNVWDVQLRVVSPARLIVH